MNHLIQNNVEYMSLVVLFLFLLGTHLLIKITRIKISLFAETILLAASLGLFLALGLGA